MIGRTLSHYRLVSELGRGGMGVVYRALDVNLGREVAFKVLSPQHVADAERRRRFLQEGKAAAALEHPHIGVVYEVGEAEGITFIAMQLIAGLRLADMLRLQGRLPVGRAVELARELAEGLATAHDKGIVHRDLNPSNVIVTDDGHAKIIDFGLAKLTEPLSAAHAEAETRPQTEAGMVLGTAAYMSPEQAQGKPADARSDVFTLGVVLYEMLSGQTPFKCASVLETVHAIINTPDPPVTLADESGPAPELRRIVHKCLAKDPRDRYQSMKDLVVDLREVSRRLTAGSSAMPVVAPSPARRWRWAAVSLAVAILAVGIGYISTRPAAPSTAAPGGARKRIAVLIFENMGAPEDAYFAAGVTEEITSRLSGVSQLAVISRNSVLQYSHTDKGSQQIGRELNVDFILHGTVRWQPAKDGPGRVRVTPQLTRIADDTQVWSDSFERRFEEIFEMQSDIALQVTQRLNATVLAPERRLIEMRPTENLEAYKEYLRGNYLFYHQFTTRELATKGRLDALAPFERAVALDPSFAQGHAAVAIAAAWRFFYVEPSREWEQRADAAIDKALALEPNLAEAYLARGNLLWTQPRGFPHERAIREYRRALALNPNLAEAHVAVGRLYTHVGLLDEAREHLTLAIQLDPANEEAQGRLVLAYQWQHDHQAALTVNDRVPQSDNWNLVQILSYLGRDQEARLLANRLLPSPWVIDSKNTSAPTFFNVVLLARERQSARVDAMLPSLETVAQNAEGLGHLHHNQYYVGLAHALRGRKREAVTWLRKAAADGFPCYPFFVEDPNLAGLAGDPEFERFMVELKAGWERLKVAAHE